MSRWRTCVALYILAIPGGEVSAGCAEDIAASIMATANAPVVRTSSTIRLPGVLYALARPSTTERWELRGKVFKMKTTTRTGDEVSRETILIGTDYWAREGGQGWRKLDATVGKREHYFWRLVNSRDKKTGAETLRNVPCGDPSTEAGAGKRHLAHEIETFNGGFRHTAAHHYIVDPVTKLILSAEIVEVQHGHPDLGNAKRVTTLAKQYSYEPIADIKPPSN